MDIGYEIRIEERYVRYRLNNPVSFSGDINFLRELDSFHGEDWFGNVLWF